jgi:hypothetical protein
MGTEQKIIVLAEKIIEQAQHLVTNAKDIPKEIKSAYNFMADQCQEYYNGSDIENYTTRALLFASSAVSVVESYGQPITENIANKFHDSIQELSTFGQDTLREAKRVKKSTSEDELTDGQKAFIQETSQFITGLISVGALVTGIAVPVILVLGTSIAVVTVGSMLAAPAITAAMVTSPALASAGLLALIAGDMAVIGGAYVGPLGLTAAMLKIVPAIYSIHQDVCKFKEQNSNQNLTPKELWNIIDKTNHIKQGQDLICSAIESVLKSFELKNEKLLESGLKKAIVAKEVTKSVGKNLSNAVASSKVGKTANRAKNMIQRSASRAKVKFTDVVKNAREKVEQGIGSPSRK